MPKFFFKLVTEISFMKSQNYSIMLFSFFSGQILEFSKIQIIFMTIKIILKVIIINKVPVKALISTDLLLFSHRKLVGI